MATKYPWRFQADLKKGETDPMVTIFLGAEIAVLDDGGDPTDVMAIAPNMQNPVILPLSQMTSALADPKILTALQAELIAKSKAVLGVGVPQ